MEGNARIDLHISEGVGTGRLSLPFHFLSIYPLVPLLLFFMAQKAGSLVQPHAHARRRQCGGSFS